MRTYDDAIYSATIFGWVIFVIFVISNVMSYFMFLGFVAHIHFSVIYILMLILLLMRYAWEVLQYGSKFKLTPSCIIGWMIIIWVTILHFIWYHEILRAGGGEEFWGNAAQTLLLAVFMWLVGLLIGRRFENSLQSTFLRIILWFVFLLLGSVVIYGILISQKMFGNLVFYFYNYKTGQCFNYLILADIIAVWGLLLMGCYKSNIKLGMVVYFLTSIFLFFAFSRAAFFLFIFFGGIYLWFSLRSLKARFCFVVFIVIVLLMVIVGMYGFEADFHHIYAIERVTILIENPKSDSSYQGRLALLQQGLNALSNSWILGQYMSEWWETGRLGGYVHNWLSFLIAYGIGPFLLFLILSVLLCRKAYILFKKFNQLTPIVLLFFALVAIILARSYVWYLIWFVIGFVANYTYKGEKKHEDRFSFPLEPRVGERGI